MKMRKSAFSLLELMVAIAILSAGLVMLFQVQARSVALAQQAREITVATQLARGKLLDCQTDLLKKGFSVDDYETEGNFDDEGYADFFWECHGYKPDMPTIDGGGADAAGLLGAAGADDSAADAAQDQGGDIGMSFLAPVLSQMSGILGDSIRELVVIVRWGQGEDMQEMSVTTHVIDKGPVNQVAGMISAQANALKSLTGGGGGSESDSDGGNKSNGGTPPPRNSKPPRGGGPKG
jgi:prepilin-type N-terminal cleavage/methylation domain-containing protein